MASHEVFSNRAQDITTCVHELEGVPELAELGNDLATRTDPRYVELRRASKAYHSSYDFTGTHSLSEAVRLAREGWPEGVERLNNAPEINVDVDYTTQPQPFFDLSGEEVDVGRYLTGEPENMIAYQMAEQPRDHIIELIVQGNQPAETTKEQIIGRGAVILAAAQAMQSRGFSIGITYATASRGPQWYDESLFRSEYYLPLQEIGQVTDVDTLAFALLHPSMLRRLMFGAYEQLEPAEVKERRDIRLLGTYGYADSLQYPPMREHPTVIVPRHFGLAGGTQAAQALANKMVEATATAG
ncbi:MAG TPA: hypothetical protein VLG16_01140 [Candidatus Saccharimonadales bacterium]|nr:hypothetical protein [Candidatus Saccharimonadales bacterium]